MYYEEVWYRAMMDNAYTGPMDPVHPCRIMSTRHCPVSYEGICGDRPCARYESTDETPWQLELKGPTDSGTN